jgi:hypothetical protein
MPKFSDIANKKLEETVRPPLAPIGLYIGQVVGTPSITPRSGPNGDFEILDINLAGVQPVEDAVDMEELTTFGGAKNVRAKKSFIFNSDDEVAFLNTENQVKRFVRDHLKITEEDAPTYMEALGIAAGRTLVFEIVHKADKTDPDLFHANVGKTMPNE